MKAYWYKITLGCAVVFALVLLTKSPQGFSVAAVQFDIPFNARWEIEPLEKEKKDAVNQILQQKFSYLAKGARCLAFVSEDDTYVLKFFKFRYHKPHWTVRYLPSIFPFDYFKKKKQQKVSLDTVLTGYKNAYEKDSRGTGMIFVHLNPESCGLPEVALEDKDGKAHSIDLNRTRFVLQRRSQELSDVLCQLLGKNDVEQAKKVLTEVVELYVSHFRLGLYDLGRGFIRNNGFVGDVPIHFDVGKLTIDGRIGDATFQQEVLSELVKNGQNWLLKTYPEYSEAIIESLQETIAAMYRGQGKE